MATPTREQILVKVVTFVTVVGMILPAAYALSIALSDISNYLARLDVVGWMLDCASILSVPWVAVATILIIGALARPSPEVLDYLLCERRAGIHFAAYLHHAFRALPVAVNDGVKAILDSTQPVNFHWCTPRSCSGSLFLLEV